MKQSILLAIGAFIVFTANAQLPVSHTAGKKQVLIEEFTGNNCQYCPDGHKIVDQIIAANPGKVFGVNLHEVNEVFANPSNSNAKDFRVPEADYIMGLPNMFSASGSGSIGYPAGAVNRTAPVSPAVPYNTGGYLMSRQYWAGMVSTILSQNSYINVAGQAYLHPTTRQMVINMQAYYTANSPVSSNRITIELVQNNVLAYQLNASSYPAMVVGSSYKHNHALRDILTSGNYEGALGETMTGPTTSGTTWSKTYTFTVPAFYPIGGTSKTIPAVLADLELIAFISQTSSNVIAVCKVPITITTSTDIFNPELSNEIISTVNVYPNPMGNEGAVVFTLHEPNPVTIEVVNALGQIVKSDKLDMLSIGEHKYDLNSINLTNGIYFVNVKVDKNTVTKKISILK